MARNILRSVSNILSGKASTIPKWQLPICRHSPITLGLRNKILLPPVIRLVRTVDPVTKSKTGLLGVIIMGSLNCLGLAPPPSTHTIFEDLDHQMVANLSQLSNRIKN